MSASYNSKTTPSDAFVSRFGTVNVKTQRPWQPCPVSVICEPQPRKPRRPPYSKYMAKKTKESQDSLSSSSTKTPEEASTR